MARLTEQHPKLSEIADRDVVIVQSGGYVKWACLRCPCGCGDKITLSLDRNRTPGWAVTIDWLSRPSVSPSVWQKARCRSHFWIRRGSVEWCVDSGRGNGIKA